MNEGRTAPSEGLEDIFEGGGEYNMHIMCFFVFITTSELHWDSTLIQLLDRLPNVFSLTYTHANRH